MTGDASLDYKASAKFGQASTGLPGQRGSSAPRRSQSQRRVQETRANVRKSLGLEHKSQTEIGYTVDKFVRDNLVPVEGVCCFTPVNAARAKELRGPKRSASEPGVGELFVLNALIADALAKSQEHERFGATARLIMEGQAPKKEGPAIPPEAVCRVRLWQAEIEGDARQSFDFNQETKLEVKVFGALIFPPWFSWADYERYKAQNSKTARYIGSKGFITMQELPPDFNILNVQVWVVLERSMEPSDDRNSALSVGTLSQQTPLRVKCLHMLVESVGDQGDAMIESWLPVRDILQDIEDILARKLEQSIKGFENDDL
eukprot:CAMPEP_0170577796 /NCGR_PEP_ID=MMETSP0224-20130122/5118_1 /TAXON_ID=285029 /ORGANISM="Togula jolla, Strain CCCM 725" /LENGTH=316 /DNA_ID=CAMNT_0010900731 /DNA_START=56 /DNA_END=1006 /DNA_ORIENTATION=-